jgi:uracil-DNA glycosylase
MTAEIPLHDLLTQVRACRVCEPHLPLGPRPVLRAQASARILIVGQAPGTRVHATGIPWNDPSGDRLRQWMGVDRDTFYNQSHIAIVPMGFCYPGKGKSGDLPPRKECAQLWHSKVLQHLSDLQLVLLVGSYAQSYYLSDTYKTLTDRVKAWREFGPRYLPLVHPSPRNRLWLKNNAWFERDVVPYLQSRVKELLLKD